MAKSNGHRGDTGEPEDTMELPLLELPGTHTCNDCGECCTYLAVEIDHPTSFEDIEHVFWYLTHRDVSVYIDWEGDWFIEFRTVCEHVTDEKTCGIYEERPKICSDFSWNECERTTRERAWKYHFEKPDQYFDWLREKQPARYDKYTKARRKQLEKRRAQQTEEAEPPAAAEGDVQAGA
ncbi:MAG: YkgJ family cysteine cluster protein [Deltaproteobacteria bacterium]|nr:YkgJ family cysteine cluster protein [Deltaproteobacteria bacterium]MBW2414060.1 YkgJ family cysteine cluster protein [Deltaproteobacteria bacterium]